MDHDEPPYHRDTDNESEDDGHSQPVWADALPPYEPLDDDDLEDEDDEYDDAEYVDAEDLDDEDDVGLDDEIDEEEEQEEEDDDDLESEPACSQSRFTVHQD
jgi:hypothetical protein